jgi:hypothetical protein
MLANWIGGIHTTILVAIMNLVATQEWFSRYTKKIQDDYPKLKALFCGISKRVIALRSLLQLRETEPFTDNWILLSGHCHTKRSLFMPIQNRIATFFGFFARLDAKYEYFKLYPSQTQSSSECIRVINLYVHLALSRIYSNYTMSECLLVLNAQNRQFIRIFKREIPNKIEGLDPDKLFQPSRVKFISVELVFPYTETSYVIELDRSIYFVDNEILSRGFLTRYLDHHYGIGLMGEDYLLNIMDNNMDMVQLKKTDYIILDRNGYKIVRLER